jgi:ribosomal-protein-alanine acetyltransferase
MIRPITDNDIKFVQDLEEAHHLTPCVLTPLAQTWIYEKDSKPVGFLTWIQTEDSADLLNIAIEVNSMRCGFGKALLTQWQDHLKSLGMKQCFLEVRAKNYSAIAFYVKHGFVINRLRKNYYEATNEDAYEMRIDYV